MSARVGLAVGGVLFAAAVVLAGFGLWLLAVAVLYGSVYVAGRWDRRRDRDAAVAAAVAVKDARIAALEDELTYRYDAQVDSRWAGDNRLMPDNGGGHYSPAAVNDRNSTAATTTARGVAAPERAAPLP